MSTLYTDHDPVKPSIDIDLPLHPKTNNGEHVALLVQRILNVVEHPATDSDMPSQSDVIQALTIATALRATFAEVSARTGHDFSPSLLEIDVNEPRSH
jgi:hypothetical protein